MSYYSKYGPSAIDVTNEVIRNGESPAPPKSEFHFYKSPK
jgi:hypothetical protein